MKLIPVPMVQSPCCPYEKGPQGSGDLDGVRQFLIGVLGGATAASQVRSNMDTVQTLFEKPSLIKSSFKIPHPRKQLSKYTHSSVFLSM